MEQKRLLLFVVLSATVIFFWQMFIVPRIAPRPQVVAEQQAENAPVQDEQDPDLPLVAKKPPRWSQRRGPKWSALLFAIVCISM